MYKKAAKVLLSARQLAIVKKLAHSRTEEKRLVERAEVVLRSANDEQCIDQAAALGIELQRVTRWRKRFSRAHSVLAAVEAASENNKPLELKIREVLGDKFRSGSPGKFTPEQVTMIIALACHQPEELNLPLSHWTGDELARQAVAMGIVENISGRHVARFLKRSRHSPASVEVLAQSKN
jgi:hypothetical protein